MMDAEAAVASAMQGGMMGQGGMTGQGGMMGGGLMMVFGWIVSILGLVLLVLLIVWLVRELRGNGKDGGSSPEDPLEIARRRYARGEIDGEQFRSIRDTLFD